LAILSLPDQSYLHGWTFADHALVALERIFRLLQATVYIILSDSFAFGLFLHILNTSTVTPPPPEGTRSILLDVFQSLDLIRRLLRVFQFLNSFHAAHNLFLSVSPFTPANGRQKPGWVQAKAWIDVLGHTFNGMYFLLTTSTIIDALHIEGLKLWAPEWERRINIEAQRFWLFALVCGLISGLLQMIRILVYAPEFVHGKTEENSAATTTGKEKMAKMEKPGKPDTEKVLRRPRNIVKKRTEERVLWMQEARTELHWLGRNVVANALDIVLPGAVVGWIDVSPRIVGLTMFSTTILTSIDIWARCGREVLSKN
jgi:hypothetical protein